jgi:hypothetical protein
MPGGGSEPRQATVGYSGRSALLERLGSTEGADLYDAQGQRIGTFIELVGGGTEVAIRHEGAFVWRRRVLPFATVAAVLPEHGARGAVVLNVAEKTLDRANDTQAGTEDHLQSTDENRVSEKELTARLAPYVTTRDSHEDLSPSTSSREYLAQHLLFVPTPQGYQLVEQDGDTPTAFAEVSLPGHENAFRVIKVARSPLPSDDRLCAYLERR